MCSGHRWAFSGLFVRLRAPPVRCTAMWRLCFLRMFRSLCHHSRRFVRTSGVTNERLARQLDEGRAAARMARFLFSCSSCFFDLIKAVVNRLAFSSPNGDLRGTMG